MPPLAHIYPQLSPSFDVVSTWRTNVSPQWSIYHVSYAMHALVFIGRKGRKGHRHTYLSGAQCVSRFRGERISRIDHSTYVPLRHVDQVASTVDRSLSLPSHSAGNVLIKRDLEHRSIRRFGMALAIKVSDERAQQVDALPLAREVYALSLYTYICIYIFTRAHMSGLEI